MNKFKTLHPRLFNDSTISSLALLNCNKHSSKEDTNDLGQAFLEHLSLDGDILGQSLTYVKVSLIAL